MSKDAIIAELMSKPEDDSDKDALISQLKSNQDDGFDSHFIRGVDKITGAIASVPESIFGTLKIGGEGIEYLTPEEAKEQRDVGFDEGGIGLPYAAQEEPTSVFESGAQLAGETAAVAPLFGAVLGTIPASASAGLIAKVQNLFSGMGATFVARPVTTTVAESALGYTAGMFGQALYEKYPNSSFSRLLGEVVGGTAPQFMPAKLAYKTVSSGIGRLRSFKSDPKAWERASGRYGRSVSGAARDRAVSELDQPTTLDSQGNKVLTPAQMTSDAGLMELEKSVVNSSEELIHKSDEQIANANAIIQQSLRDMGGESSAPTIEAYEQAQKYLGSLLDTRIRIAVQKADERVGELGKGANREQANIIARTEIEKAIQDARTQETSLYNRIPEDTLIPTSAATKTLVDEMNRLGKAQLKLIPPDVRKYLLPKINGKPNKNYYGEVTTIKEMRSLQSELRQQARDARAIPPNFNKARIADAIANAITDDIANAVAAPDVAEKVKDAVGFSNLLNTRIGQSEVGRITGRNYSGAAAVPSGQTLEATIGLSGPKGRDAFDDIMGAFDLEGVGSNTVTRVAMEDYMKAMFLREVSEGGMINTKKANRFMHRFDENLSRMPNLKKEFESAIKSQDAKVLTETQKGRVKLNDPRVSKATMLIQKGPVETFKQISRLRPKDAITEANNLMNMASRDQSGEAVEGLRAGFIEYLVDASKKSDRDVTDRVFLSGMDMKDLLSTPAVSGVVKIIFPNKQMQSRLNVIANDLSKLEKYRNIRASKEGVIGDAPGKILESIAGVMGAAVGRKYAQATGSGGTVQIPGIFAQRFRELVAAGVRDPAAELIKESIFNEKLFRDVLMSPITKKGEVLPQTKRALNAWAATILIDRGINVVEEEPIGIESSP